MSLDEVSLNEVRRLIRRANFRLKAEEYEAAFDLFKNALEYIPESVEIMNILGALSFEMGNFEEAIRYYRDSIVVDDNEKTQVELGFALISNHQLEEAFEIFSNLDSSQPRVKAGQAISLIMLNQDLQRAIDLLKGLDLSELSMNVSDFLGLAYSQLGMHNQALTEFRKNISHWKNSHAVGVQYLAMISNQVANRHFNDALNKYQDEWEQESRDKEIEARLQFDLILSEPDTQYRLALLQSKIEEGILNLEIYLALIATQYEISNYNSPLDEYIIAAKEYLNVDQSDLLNLFDSWLEKIRGIGEN